MRSRIAMIPLFTLAMIGMASVSRADFTPLQPGGATEAKQPSLGTAGTPSSNVLTFQGITGMTPVSVTPASGNFWQATQPISGSVSVSNFPATQPVSIMSLPLPTGAAQDSTLTGGTQTTRITDGTNTANVVTGSTGQNALLSAGAMKEVTFSTSVVAAVAMTDTSNFRWVSVQTNALAGTAIFQGSNDGTNWIPVSLVNAANVGTSIPVITPSAAGTIFAGPINSHYFRINVTSTGTTSGIVDFFANPGVTYSTLNPVSQNGTWTVLATQNGTWTITANPTRSTIVDRSGSITTGGTAQTAVPSNSTRVYLFIQNVSNADEWYNFTTAATNAQPSIKLVAGASITYDGTFLPTDAVSMWGATTAQQFTIKEK